MAQGMTQIPELGFANSRKAVAAISSGADITTPANYASITALRTRLAAISAGYYTATRLDEMTVNDMIYAVRLADDSTSFGG